jgi:hypothetical protein
MTKIVDTKRPTTDVEKNEADVEMNATTEDSETVLVAASPAIPTRMDIFFDFNGSLGFAVGSSGFIFAMYYTNWLPYFRYGSLTWIWGCVMYSIPLLQKLKGGFSQRSCPWGMGDLGEFLCYSFYAIGCVMGGFFDEQAVDRFLPAINHTFVYGSFSLALEPLYQVFLFLTRGGSCRSRIGATKLCGSSSTTSVDSNLTADNNNSNNNNSNSNETETSLLQLKLNWDRCLELFAMTFFCAAGVFGGFPPHPSLALPGVYFWLVGSLFSMAGAFLMVYHRNQGLKAGAVPNN